MLKVFYYYYYLFYSKVLVQPEPHFVTVLVLSAMEGFLISYSIEFLSVNQLCILPLDIEHKLFVHSALLIINYIYFERKGKGLEIVKKKPKFFNNHYQSIAIVLLVTLLIISFLFWAADYKLSVLKKCQ